MKVHSPQSNQWEAIMRCNEELEYYVYTVYIWTAQYFDDVAQTEAVVVMTTRQSNFLDGIKLLRVKRGRNIYNRICQFYLSQ